MDCTLTNGEVGNINLGLIISDGIFNITNLRVHELQEVSHLGGMLVYPAAVQNNSKGFP